MPDLLVKLYDLPSERPSLPNGVTMRPVMAAEVSMVRDWIEENFSRGWADEFLKGAYAETTSSIIALEDRKVIGFVCYDVSAIGMFGPTGVDKSARGRGLGAALLFAALEAMVAKGHVYATIGWVGPIEFYEKLVGATVIEGSEKRYSGKLIQS